MSKATKTGTGRGICVAANAEAAEAGAAILRLGGNAFDAAAAAGFVEAVISPSNCGVGGYGATGVGFLAAKTEVFAIDANTVAPAAARADMFPVMPTRDPNNYKLLDDRHKKGPLSVGVPGVLAGLVLLAEKYGKLGRKAIMAPVLQHLSRGVVLTPGQTLTWMTLRAESEGKPAPDRAKLPKIAPMDELADTLHAVAEEGAAVFYEGRIGRAIAEDVRRRGGILNEKDMAAYKAEIAPTVGRVVNGQKLVAPAPSSGGLTSIQFVALLDRLRSRGTPGTADWYACLMEVAKVAWEDRLTTLGDFRSMETTPELFLSDDHLDALFRKVEAGVKAPSPGRIVAPDPLRGTVHLAAADEFGNVISWTQTHGGGFGSMLMAKGTGVVLGHGMCRFEPRPGRPNSIAPGRRPLHNMCPTLLLRDGKAVGAIGAAGGRTIVNNVGVLSALRVLDGYGAERAQSLPRLQLETLEPAVLEKSAGGTVFESLKKTGRLVKETNKDAGSAQVIVREGEFWAAAAEPRSADSGVATV